MIPRDLLQLEILELFAEAHRSHLPHSGGGRFLYIYDLRKTRARGYDIQAEQNLRASLRRGVKLAVCPRCGLHVEMREGRTEAQHVGVPWGRCPKRAA